MKTFALIFIFLSLIVTNLSANIIEVPNDYATIQEAIDSAVVHEDTVFIHPGIYYENIVKPDMHPSYFPHITLLGKYYFTKDEHDIDSTIIDGGQNGSIIYSEITLEVIGITFQHGKSDKGGAIRVNGYTLNHQIKNCVFRNNQASKGGVVFADLTLIDMMSCKFYNNSGSLGGVGYSENEGSLTFTNSEFWGNHAEKGGVCYTYWDSGIYIFGCKIFANSANNGGAFAISFWGHLSLSGTSIHNNSASGFGGAVYCDTDEKNVIGFDKLDRSSMYNNEADMGKEIYSKSYFPINVCLDTFAVCDPLDLYTYPQGFYILDVINPIIPCDTTTTISDFEEWELCSVPEASNFNLTVVNFFNNKNGSIGTSDGAHILRTSDGGMSWEIINTNIKGKPIRNLAFWNEQEGILLSYNSNESSLLKTFDGGSTWSNIILPDTSIYTRYTYLKVYDYNRYIITNLHTSYLTRDGGKSWENLELKLKDICIVSDTLAFGLGDFNYIYKSTNNGNTWQNYFDMEYSYRVYSISFFTDSMGLASKIDDIGDVYKDAIHKISKENENWYDYNKYIYNSFNWYKYKKVLMFSPDTAYVISQSYSEKLLKTTDGGETWSAFTLADDIHLNDIYKVPETGKGFIVGDNGLILTRKGVPPPRYSAATKNAFIEGFPNPASGQVLIDYFIPESQKITITIYNVLGQKISKILDEYAEKKGHRLIYDCKPLANGIYFLVLKTKQSVATHKIIVLH